MSGKGDKWRKTDYKQYFNSPFWENLKNKKPLESLEDISIKYCDAKLHKDEEQRVTRCR